MNARDNAMTALILGFFASSWFGWAQERPPAAWRSPLIAGAVLSIVVAVVGAVLAWRNWSAAGSALSEPGAMRRYGIIVGVEFGVAAAAVVVSRRSDLAPSAVTGAGAGVALLGYAIWGAVSAIA